MNKLSYISKIVIIIVFIISIFLTMKNNRIKNETNVGVKGSFMIAAIGNDGVIVATETRGNIFDLRDSNEIPMGYYDGVQKEFIIGNLVLASTGKGAIGNIFFSSLIKDFNKVLLKQPPINDFFTVFKDFCIRTIPKNYHNQIFSNLMLVAGFENNVPVICYFQNQKVGCIENEGYVESDVTIFKEQYSKEYNCEKLAILAEKAIVDYSSKNNKWKTIGGDVCIIKITKDNGPIWIKKIDFKDWTYINELISDYYNNKLVISLIEPYRKQDLDLLFKNN